MPPGGVALDTAAIVSTVLEGILYGRPFPVSSSGVSSSTPSFRFFGLDVYRDYVGHISRPPPLERGQPLNAHNLLFTPPPQYHREISIFLDHGWLLVNVFYTAYCC